MKIWAFHIVDSQSLRWSYRIGMAGQGFRKSASNRNIKAISIQTWEMINRDIPDYAPMCQDKLSHELKPVKKGAQEVHACDIHLNVKRLCSKR